MNPSENNHAHLAIQLLNILGKIILGIGALGMFLAAIFPLEDGNLLVRGVMVLIPFFIAALLYALIVAMTSIVESLHPISQNLSKADEPTC